MSIPPLITHVSDDQSLYAPANSTSPIVIPTLQSFSCVPSPCIGGGTLSDGATTNLFSAVVPYLFGENSWCPFVTTKAGFNYTATTTTGSISFILKVNGATIQTITQTPNTSAQLVLFDQYFQLFATTTGVGTYLFSIDAVATGTTTITTTNAQSFYGVVIGCRHA